MSKNIYTQKEKEIFHFECLTPKIEKIERWFKFYNIEIKYIEVNQSMFNDIKSMSKNDITYMGKECNNGKDKEVYSWQRQKLILEPTHKEKMLFYLYPGFVHNGYITLEQAIKRINMLAGYKIWNRCIDINF